MGECSNLIIGRGRGGGDQVLYSRHKNVQNIEPTCDLIEQEGLAKYRYNSIYLRISQRVNT